MHMADALLSPAVGGVMWAVSGGTLAYCAKKVRDELDDRKVPLMGVLGAFIFAAQMINFSIPATGSSGHLGGGLLLTILLGPHAAFITIASVLVVQSLFFADGGILALGCNIFNMGVFPAFIAYPLIYKKIAGDQSSHSRITIGAIVAAAVGLQLGAFGVVLETVLSGISSLPFSTFMVLMQPIHLAIGVVEGMVTAAVVSFVYKARPEVLTGVAGAQPTGDRPVRNLLIVFLAAALLTGGFFSWFASEHPDGLEWSIAKVTGKEEVETARDELHDTTATIQEKTSFLPDYSFKKPENAEAPAAVVKTGGASAAGETVEDGRLGTTVSGIIGAVITLGMALIAGFLLKKRRQST
jgi:cobalt/nickel transport system permease protein